MVDIFTPNKLAREKKGTTAKDNGFHSFSVKPYSPTDRGIKVGRAGARVIASDKRGVEDASSREKYRDNYDRIFGKKK